MSTLERLNNCLAAMLFDPATSDDQRFVEDLGFDSLDFMELSISIEDEFGFKVPDEDYENGKISTVRQAVEYIDGRLAEEGK
jgi:acyl carrier protein